MTFDQVKALYQKHGYKFYDSGKYNVNNFGRRNADRKTVNTFNDIRGIAYLDAFGQKQCLEWACTTKPGLSYLGDKVGNPNGTAILIPGYYPKCWKLGKHNRGKEHEHDALEQAGPGVFKVWRDGDQDGAFDFDGPIYDDVTGLNDHTTRAHDIHNVGGFSAGCQVTQDDKEHMIKMAICMRAAELYGDLFSYALFQD